MSDGGLSLTALHLCCSLRLQRRYSEFRSALQKSLPLGDNLAPLTVGTEEIDAVDTEESDAIDTDEPDDVDTDESDITGTKEINAALQVLQTERMRKKAEEEDEAADTTEAAEARALAGDDFGAMAIVQDENAVGELDQPQDPVDNAFEVLVCNAIEEFGFAPRDVYNGVFKLSQTKAQHVTEIRRTNYSRLEDLVNVFPEERGLDEFSHHVVALKPYYHTLDEDLWKIHFKSARIARQVVELMRSKEDDHIRDMYALFLEDPESSCLAGPFFESIAHRALASKHIQPIPMTVEGDVPLTFSTRGTPLAPSTPPCVHARATRRLDLLHELSSVTSGQYCILTSTTNPLFDSFTIDIDADKRTAVISVFHIMASPRHGGSSQGYLIIRNIMKRARKLLELPSGTPGIEVSYFLVCPDDGSQHQWNMPVDWERNTTVNDHRGKAYCIRIPSEYLKVRRVYSLQINLRLSWIVAGYRFPLVVDSSTCERPSSYVPFPYSCSLIPPLSSSQFTPVPIALFTF